MSTIQEDLRDVRKLKLAYDALKAKTTLAETAFKRKQQEVYDRLEAEGVGSIADKRTKTLFVPAETTYAAIQDRSEFVKWAKENDVELIHETERGDLLNALVRERIDNGEPLPPGVGVRVRQYISQRAA